MNTTITSAAGFASHVAKLVIGQVIGKPNSVLCFATGGTTKPIFDEIVRLKHELDIDFSQAFAMNLDEYVGVNASDPASCCYRIRHDLYDPLGIDEQHFYVPTAIHEHAEQECVRFGSLIERLGGIDLMLLSVGENGHIAFNEPGTPLETGIHIADISPSTVAAKQELFGGAEKVPRCGITMGISTIMLARKILLVANGRCKADIMHKGLNGPVTTDVPVSVMQLHPFVEVILDELAANHN